MIHNLSFRNLSWLLASLTLVMAPHAPRLPLWVPFLCVAIVLWRLFLAWRNHPLPPHWLLMLLAFSAIGGIFLSYGTIFGRDTSVTLLIVLTAMKLLETHRQRDAMVAVFLGYFIVITNFLYSQTIPTALYMLLVVLVITATLVGFNHMSSPPRTMVRLRLAGVLLAQAVPLMIILFVFFPRVQGPLWGLPQDAHTGVSGLSDSMTPGSISRLILSDAVAFRVNFEGDIPKAKQLYWRGPVLWQFDGKTWSPGRADSLPQSGSLREARQGSASAEQVSGHDTSVGRADSLPQSGSLREARQGSASAEQVSGHDTSAEPKSTQDSFQYEAQDKPVKYAVTLEPHNNHWLFALDMPASLPPESTASGDYQVLSRTPVRSRIRYEIASHLSYRIGLNADKEELIRALQLPPAIKVETRQGGNPNNSNNPDNPRARALAASWRRDIGNDEAIVREALSLFHNQQFFYTLLPPLLKDNPVDEFLFDTRQGFCEHYSSSFAFLMRAAGIPARVVAGYQGGEINPAGGYMIVRQSDAHAWTEVWLKGRGWVRTDPTAAVSPARIESGIAAAVPASDPLPMMVRTQFEWLRGMRLSLDVIAAEWNQWVLGYNPRRQMDFLSRAGMKAPDWQSMTVALITGTGILLLGFAATMLRHLHHARRDPVQAAWLKFCGKLAKRGIPRQAHEGPRDYAERLAGLRPDIAPTANTISDLYIALRYGTLEQEEAVQELHQRVKDFSTADS